MMLKNDEQLAASTVNPAKLSLLISSMFPIGVVGAELKITADPSLLSPLEASSLGQVTLKRAQEYTAGRLCARRALAEFGIQDHALCMDHDRRPQWPESIIGSISHSIGLCGVAVAQRSRFSGIGMDIEVVDEVTQDIWPYICTPEERIGIGALPKSERQRCAALIYSAKETFYKCQYGITKQWLEFGDVIMNYKMHNSGVGMFTLRMLKKPDIRSHNSESFFGRFRFYKNVVVTGMVIA